MSTIHVTSFIHAPVERTFDLSRSTSLHKAVLRTYRKGALEGGFGRVDGAGRRR